MGNEKLSRTLLDLEFFCALGTKEKTRIGELWVRRGTPLTYDFNNGVTVVYDERGHPWIATTQMTLAKFREEVVHEYNLRMGAHVPHSNDGGFFVREVLPRL